MTCPCHPDGSIPSRLPLAALPPYHPSRTLLHPLPLPLPPRPTGRPLAQKGLAAPGLGSGPGTGARRPRRDSQLHPAGSDWTSSSGSSSRSSSSSWAAEAAAPSTATASGQPQLCCMHALSRKGHHTCQRCLATAASVTPSVSARFKALHTAVCRAKNTSVHSKMLAGKLVRTIMAGERSHEGKALSSAVGPSENAAESLISLKLHKPLLQCQECLQLSERMC